MAESDEDSWDDLPVVDFTFNDECTEIVVYVQDAGNELVPSEVSRALIKFAHSLLLAKKGFYAPDEEMYH